MVTQVQVDLNKVTQGRDIQQLLTRWENLTFIFKCGISLTSIRTCLTVLEKHARDILKQPSKSRLPLLRTEKNKAQILSGLIGNGYV